MNKKIIIIIILIMILCTVIFAGFKFFGLGFKKVEVSQLEIPEWKKNQVIENKGYIPYVDESNIKYSTDGLEGAAKKYYSKFIDYIAPNGKPIRILAMDKITNDQLLYAYNMLSFYLKSNDKINKDEIANNLANNKAILILPNGADRDGKTPMAAMNLGQNLNQMEIANIGSKWYIDCDYTHRDAAFEEIFHMVHDYGIGTTQNSGAAPEITKIIADAKNNSLPTDKSDWGNKGLWGLNSKSWLEELEKEGSLEQEYIVSVIDSYYGLWDSWNDGVGGMWGIYTSKNRREIVNKDPQGLKALKSFLPEYITQMMRIDSSFAGEFKMLYDSTLPYTSKSQYLQNIALTGSNDVNLIANDLDNILMVNSGENKIDGKEGIDIVQFKGSSEEYEIIRIDDKIVVKDKIANRDGISELKNIEILRFTDMDK